MIRPPFENESAAGGLSTEDEISRSIRAAARAEADEPDKPTNTVKAGAVEIPARQPSKAEQWARVLHEMGYTMLPMGSPDMPVPDWYVRECGGDVELATREWPKRPLRKFAVMSVDQIRAKFESWAHQYPLCNWSILCRYDTGVVCLDADTLAGLDLLRKLVPGFSPVLTSKGGHVYLQDPDGLVQGPDTGGHIDKRGGANSYAIAPGSKHRTGHVYQTEDGEPLPEPGDLPMLTAELLIHVDALNKSELTTPTADVVAGTEGKAVVGSHPIGKGSRDNWLTEQGGRMRWAGLDEPAIYAQLSQVNLDRCNPPKSDADVRRIAASVSRYATAEQKAGSTPAVDTSGLLAGVQATTSAVRGQTGLVMFEDHTPRPPYRIPGLWRSGDNAVVAGPAKSLKSFLVQDMALADALCRPLLDFPAPDVPAKVAIVQAEMPLHESRARLQRHPLVIDAYQTKEGRELLARNLLITDRLQGVRYDQRGLVEVADYIEANHGKPGTLITDSLSAVYARDSEDDNAQMNDWLGEVTAYFRGRFGDELVIVFVHHTAKLSVQNMKNDPFIAIRGASALRGWYSAGLVMHRDPEDMASSRRYLHFELRGDVEPPSKLLDFDGATLRVSDERPEKPSGDVPADWWQRVQAKLITEANQGQRVHTASSFGLDFGGRGEAFEVGQNTLRSRLKHESTALIEQVRRVIEVDNPWPKGHEKRPRNSDKVMCVQGHRLVFRAAQNRIEMVAADA
jgi:hypothetical protein